MKEAGLKLGQAGRRAGGQAGRKGLAEHYRGLYW